MAVRFREIRPASAGSEINKITALTMAVIGDTETKVSFSI
jgi:hypothetical protein